MKIVFLSNYFTHHQLYLSEALNSLQNSQYFFVENTDMTDERKKLGWGIENFPDYVVHPVKTLNEKEKLQELINSADVVIQGSAPEDLLNHRKSAGELIIRYSERIYKSGFNIIRWPVRVLKFWSRHTKYKNQYLLCASAYTSRDFALNGTYINKTYKWGYFPETKNYVLEKLTGQKDSNLILWCGRFIDRKHPDDVIEVAKRLKQDGYSFQIKMIGTGDMQERLKDCIESENLQDCIQLTGSMKPEKVREYMERAGIYLFTSDFNEGWGAVLNESMNSGCAVVASHAIGAVPFLVDHKQNGLIYENGNLADLYNKVKYLLDNPDEQKRLGEAAYHTIADLWNAEVAAERFIHFIDEIKDHGYCALYESGPCSRAKIIRNNWFKEKDF